MAGLGAALGVVLVIVVSMVAPRPTASDLLPTTSIPAVDGVSPGPTVATRSMPVEQVYGRFARGGVVTSGGTEVDVFAGSAGDLMLQTGRVAAADVFFTGGALPFTRWLPSGRYPVSTLHAEAPGSGDDRIAAAMIRVRPGDPLRWELAVTAGQDPAGLGPGEFVGYGVDSGTGCFASAEAVEWLARAGSGAWDLYSRRVEAAMFPSRNELHSVADVPIGDPNQLNVIAFASGWGDGTYPSYFGLDAAGQPLVLLTDFQILDGD